MGSRDNRNPCGKVALWTDRVLDQLRWLEDSLGLVYRLRSEGLPLVIRVSGAPTLEPGMLVRLEVSAVDLLERTLAATYRETLGRAHNATEEASEKT